VTAAPAPPATPRPAASVLLVRPGAASPVEVYMIRRQKSMRFLGGFYAFPGGKVEAADAGDDALGRCRGVSAAAALTAFPPSDGFPPLAFWVTAARELVEETGLLVGCDADGRPVDVRDGAVGERVDRLRAALMAGEAPFAALLAREGWHLDLAPFRYLSHFITPLTSPIRFTARFFLAPVPAGQEPRLLGEEASEGFWIDPAEGHRRFLAGEMQMAEPADCGLRYLSGFDDLDAVWAAHRDGRHKFHGINDRLAAAGFPIPRGRHSGQDASPPLPSGEKHG
jgi:8-oxo-dGTP pyrophosphatase MutT (NUDIX family)